MDNDYNFSGIYDFNSLIYFCLRNKTSLLDILQYKVDQTESEFPLASALLKFLDLDKVHRDIDSEEGVIGKYVFWSNNLNIFICCDTYETLDDVRLESCFQGYPYLWSKVGFHNKEVPYMVSIQNHEVELANFRALISKTDPLGIGTIE